MTENEILKQVQLIEIELLDEFVRICDKYKLTYFIMYGTLIGAVRHKGFIPWDDDIDVVMPRNDYEIFRNICVKEIKDAYCFQDFSTDPHYTDCNLHIRKKNTKYINRKTENFGYICDGIWLDIFPLDGVAQNEFLKGKLRYILVHKLTQLSYIKAYKKLDGLDFKTKVLHYLCPLSLSTIYRLREFFAQKQNKMNYDFLVNFGSPYRFEKELIDKRYWESTVKIDFEGKSYNAPKEYDEILRQIYGDYMTPPAKSEQCIYHKPRIIEFSE